MGRRTYSLSAVAVLAIASLSFSSGDGAEAFAQAADIEAATQAAASADDASVENDAIEIVPETPAFISQEIVQPLPEPSEAESVSGYDADSLRELVSQVGGDQELTEEMRCLAGAVYFESRGEPLYGQLAVAEVVINRAEDRRWPASYCGVVYQRAQFSFVRGGRMPAIRTSSTAWQRAKAVAKIAHEGLWKSEANDAVYFHANYVRPKWSHRKTRLAQIDTHVFYR